MLREASYSSGQGKSLSGLPSSKEKKGRNKQANSLDIDWTKLMESAVNDNLDPDIELESSFHSDIGADTLFLKSSTPARRDSASGNHGNREAVEVGASSHHRSTKDKEQSNSAKLRRRRSISGDPNLYVVSDLDMKTALDSDDASTFTTTSDPSQTETSADSQCSDISKRCPLVAKLRDIHEIMSSSEDVSNSSHQDAKVHLGSRLSNESVDRSSLNHSETLSMDNLSETVSAAGGRTFKHNIFSLDQLESCDPSLSEHSRQGDQLESCDPSLSEYSQQGDQLESCDPSSSKHNCQSDQLEPCDSSLSQHSRQAVQLGSHDSILSVNSHRFDTQTNTPSQSESLPGFTHQMNVYTVDELLSDGPSMSDKVEQTLEDFPRQLPKNDTYVSNSTALNHTQTLRDPRYKESLSTAPTSTGIQTHNAFNLNSAMGGHHHEKHSNVSGDEGDSVEMESQSERYSYSSDDDFESQSSTEAIADHKDSVAETTVGDSRTVLSVESKEDTLLDVTETELSHSEQPPSYTTYSASVTTPDKKRSHRDISVQTSSLPHVTNFNHSAQFTPDYNLSYFGSDYVTPSSIPSHFLPPAAMEVLSSNSPASTALNDMLRSQLALIRQSIETTKQLIANICESTNDNYHYTTLEDTKAFIRRNRPKVLTLKEVSRKQSTKSTTANSSCDARTILQADSQ